MDLEIKGIEVAGGKNAKPEPPKKNAFRDTVQKMADENGPTEGY